jgi:DNA-binding XRE family transcriptional regulator
MTTFKSALSICGLSQQQAAEFLGVSLQSVKHWSSGRTQPPGGVWEMLVDLFERVQDAADHAADAMALDGIDPRAWANIEADTGDDPLPEGADSAAGAMALMMAVSARK